MTLDGTIVLSSPTDIAVLVPRVHFAPPGREVLQSDARFHLEELRDSVATRFGEGAFRYRLLQVCCGVLGRS